MKFSIEVGPTKRRAIPRPRHSIVQLKEYSYLIYYINMFMYDYSRFLQDNSWFIVRSHNILAQ